MSDKRTPDLMARIVALADSVCARLDDGETALDACDDAIMVIRALKARVAAADALAEAALAITADSYAADDGSAQMIPNGYVGRLYAALARYRASGVGK